MLHKAKEEIIKLFDDYTTIASKAKIEATYGKELKILMPKQMLQKLPIVLEQVKASNTSENSLNEIRQIIYSFHQAK